MEKYNHWFLKKNLYTVKYGKSKKTFAFFLVLLLCLSWFLRNLPHFSQDQHHNVWYFNIVHTFYRLITVWSLVQQPNYPIVEANVTYNFYLLPWKHRFTWLSCQVLLSVTLPSVLFGLRCRIHTIVMGPLEYFFLSNLSENYT